MKQIEGIRERTVTALLFGLVLIGFIISGPLAIILLLAGVQILAFMEFSRAFFQRQEAFQLMLHIILGFAPYLLFLVAERDVFVFGLGALSVFLFFLVLVMGSWIQWTQVPRPLVSCLGIGLISIPIFCGIHLLYLLLPKDIIFLYIVLGIWAFDVFAYVVGMLLGKHPLMPAVSPKKTIEGTLGGTIFCCLLCWAFYYFDPEFGLEEAIVLAGIIILFGQTGDLAQSVLKRQSGIKDSGTLLPGHGGFWDRFDSLLAVLPAAYLYYAFTQFY